MIPRLVTSRPFINLATLIAVCICIFFINKLSNRIQETEQKIQLFQSRSTLPKLTELPLPIDYKAGAYNDILFRKVHLQGRFLLDHEIYLENRVSENSPKPNSKKLSGFHVMMPFQMDSGQVVWVNRGWIGRDPSNRQNIPDASPPSSSRSIDGYITAGRKDILEMPRRSPHLVNGHVVALDFYLHDDKKALPNRNVYPFLITQTSSSADGLIRPEENYYHTTDNSFELKTWWIILMVAIGYWLISGIVYFRQNRL